MFLNSPHISNFLILASFLVVIHLIRNHYSIIILENQVLLGLEQTISKHFINPDCNLFSGRWVYDDVSYPLYREAQCPFIESEFACEKNGRKNLKYQNWRWQPHQCDLPRFNGTAFLGKIRGKKVIYVGDSLSRNQWRSMLCMIDSYLPPSSKKSLRLRGNFYYFHSTEYNVTIGFYWAPFLVESNKDNIFEHGPEPRILRIDSIEKHGRHWTSADILVFDSFAWWMEPEIMTILWGSFESPDAVYKNSTMKLRRYEMALNTWSEWLEMHVNRAKSKLFFMSFSPYRPRATQLGAGLDSPSCYNDTEPILDETYWPSAINRSMLQIVESAIEKLEERGVKVEYLNITQLSSYREDARPSIYRSLEHNQHKQKREDLIRYGDCMHWCLPGVPDTWNQILYAYLMKP